MVSFLIAVWCLLSKQFDLGFLYVTIYDIDIPAVLVEGLNFQPAFHVHYQETVHRMHDGLPKFKDLPEPAGGSGEEIAE